MLIAVNVALVAGTVVATVVANRHLSAEISTHRASFGSCAKQVKTRIAREPIKRRIRKRSVISAKIKAECGWGDLSTEKRADVIGSVFFVVALGLFDLLLWRIWRPKME